MGKTKPFIDRSKATVYKLVHPEEGRDGSANAPNVGKLVKVSGPGDYYSDDDEQYPYREDSGSECEGDADEEPGGEFAGGEEDDEFVDEDAPGFRPGMWLRTDEDAKTEYTSWSKRTASSYLPPERRMQLWRDIDDFGLADDGYDYTQHLRNPGAGVRLDANNMSADLVKLLDKKEQMELAQTDKHTREVIATLDSDEEAAAPPLEADDEKALKAWVEEGKMRISTAEVVEEGEMADDFFRKLNDSGDEDELPDPLLSQPRDLRLLDEQFDAFLSAYDDDKIGELTHDVQPARPLGAPQEDEAYYRELLQSYINGTATMEGVELVKRENRDEEAEEPGGWGFAGDEQQDEEALAELNAKTKALALECDKNESDSDDSLEEIEVQGKVEWDCESIVSTYSNIYNHPKEIMDSRKALKIVINKGTGMPQIEGAEEEKKETQKPKKGLPAGLTTQDEGEAYASTSSGDEGESVCPSARLFELGARQRGETAEEKQARKQAAKELKSLAREKKSARKALQKMAVHSGGKVTAEDPRTKCGLSIKRY